MLKCMGDNYESADVENKTEKNNLNSDFKVQTDLQDMNKSQSLLSMVDIDLEINRNNLESFKKASSKVIVYLEKSVNTDINMKEDKHVQTDDAEKQSDYTHKILYLKGCTETFTKLSNDVEHKVSLIESKGNQIKNLLKKYKDDINCYLRKNHQNYSNAETNTYDNWLNDFCEYNRNKEELIHIKAKNENLTANYQKLENQLTELQLNILQLTNENDRLKDEISNLTYDLDNLKSDNEFVKLENDSLKEQCLNIKILETELEEVKQKCSVEVLEADQKCKHYKSEIFDEKSKRIVSDRMMTLYKTKSEKLNQELIEISNKLGPNEIVELKNENCQLKFNLQESQLQIMSYKSIESRYDDLVEQLKSQNHLINSTLTDLQNRCCTISSRNDKYRNCFRDIISEPLNTEALLEKIKTAIETA